MPHPIKSGALRSTDQTRVPFTHEVYAHALLGCISDRPLN